jgi:uncharacterized protein
VAIQFDLTQLGRHGRGEEHLDRTYEPAVFSGGGANADDEGYAIVAPVHLVMDVRKQGDVFLVTGRIDGTLRLDCGRCLEPFDVAVGAPFELRYMPVEEGGAPDEEREVGDDDLTTAYYRENAIDLEELMREQFQLALPMKPLCTEACKGLCPECGANLNTTACDCKPKWEDPRLAGLKSLLDRSKES